MFESCPKCGYQRRPADSGNPAICGGCGLVFAKWVQRQNVVAPARADATIDTEIEEQPA